MEFAHSSDNLGKGQVNAMDSPSAIDLPAVGLFDPGWIVQHPHF
jgi:hypothetical protein